MKVLNFPSQNAAPDPPLNISHMLCFWSLTSQFYNRRSGHWPPQISFLLSEKTQTSALHFSYFYHILFQRKWNPNFSKLIYFLWHSVWLVNLLHNMVRITNPWECFSNLTIRQGNVLEPNWFFFLPTSPIFFDFSFLKRVIHPCKLHEHEDESTPSITSLSIRVLFASKNIG